MTSKMVYCERINNFIKKHTSHARVDSRHQTSSSTFKVYHSHTRMSVLAPVRLKFVPWWALHGFGFFTTRMPFLTANPFLGRDARWFTGEGGCLHPSYPYLMGMDRMIKPRLIIWKFLNHELLVASAISKIYICVSNLMKLFSNRKVSTIRYPLKILLFSLCYLMTAVRSCDNKIHYMYSLQNILEKNRVASEVDNCS